MYNSIIMNTKTQSTKAPSNGKPTAQVSQSDLGERKAGGLWIKTNDKGKYLSLQIEINGQKLNLNGFDNQYYSENPDKQPKYKLFWSRDTFEILNNVLSPNSKVAVSQPAKKVVAQQESETEVDV